MNGVRGARVGLGVKQGELAGMVGVGQATISLIERGVLVPSEGLVERLEGILGAGVGEGWRKRRRLEKAVANVRDEDIDKILYIIEGTGAVKEG